MTLADNDVIAILVGQLAEREGAVLYLAVRPVRAGDILAAPRLELMRFSDAVLAFVDCERSTAGTTSTSQRTSKRPGGHLNRRNDERTRRSCSFRLEISFGCVAMSASTGSALGPRAVGDLD